MSMTIEFTVGGFSGAGVDAAGPFRVVGFLGVADAACWIKSYGSHDVHYRGTYCVNERCFTGKYRGDRGVRGHFWLRAPDSSYDKNAG
jgi:hypothetical protein